MLETGAPSLGQEEPLEKGMATHSSTLAWRIPWTEEPVGPQFWGHEELDTTEQLPLSLCSVAMHIFGYTHTIFFLASFLL